VPRADLATTASTANAVAGGVAAGFVRRGTVIDTDVVKLAATGTSAGTSPLKTVFTSGPFSLQAACWNASGGKTAIRLLFTSAEAGSILNNQTLPLDTTDEEVFRDPDDVAAMFAAPSGATLASSVYYGIKRLGADCLVAADGSPVRSGRSAVRTKAVWRAPSRGWALGSLPVPKSTAIPANHGYPFSGGRSPAARRREWSSTSPRAWS
jgi:hypothetical protein